MGLNELGLRCKPFTTYDPYQSQFHAAIWSHAGKLYIRALEANGAPTKNNLKCMNKGGWTTAFKKGVPVALDHPGDWEMPLDIEYLCVGFDKEHYLKVDITYNELLCFGC